MRSWRMDTGHEDRWKQGTYRASSDKCHSENRKDSCIHILICSNIKYILKKAFLKTVWVFQTCDLQQDYFIAID